MALKEDGLWFADRQFDSVEIYETANDGKGVVAVYFDQNVGTRPPPDKSSLRIDCPIDGFIDEPDYDSYTFFEGLVAYRENIDKETFIAAAIIAKLALYGSHDK